MQHCDCYLQHTYLQRLKHRFAMTGGWFGINTLKGKFLKKPIIFLYILTRQQEC